MTHGLRTVRHAGARRQQLSLDLRREAVVVDPQRDARRFLAAAAARKLAVRYVVETHVHNDDLSGALEIRAAARAEIAAPARGTYEFPHRAMAAGEEVRVGALRLVAWETPGHTPEPGSSTRTAVVIPPPCSAVAA